MTAKIEKKELTIGHKLINPRTVTGNLPKCGVFLFNNEYGSNKHDL